MNTDKTKLGIDAGIGGVWEKNLGVPVLDTFKNTPPNATVKKSDVAVLMAIVFKM